MKKFCMSVLLFVSILNLSEMGYTNGITYSPNQSAEYVRMPSRNASTEGDAVFYNPAGTTEFSDGFTFYASNQMLFQRRYYEDDSSSFPGATVKLHDEYKTKGNIYLFPNFYAVYKKDRLSGFAGAGPIGGAGSAEYDNGLPSMYWATFKKIYNTNPAFVSLTTSLEQDLEGTSRYLMGQVGGAYRINEVISLALAGRYVYGYENYEGEITTVIAGTSSTSHLDSTLTGDGFGIATGINLRLMKEMNIGVRYEWFSELEVKADTKKDDFGMFPDGSKYKRTIPQVIGVGLGYSILPELKTIISFNYILNAELDHDGREDNYRNSLDAGIGLEYTINPAVRVSTGYLYSQGGKKKEGNTELDQLLDYHSVGIGGVYVIGSNVEFSIGYNHTKYMDEKINSASSAGTVTMSRTNEQIAVGITFKGV